MIDLSKLTISDLKNAIWDYNSGRVPVGGLPVEHYRKELIRRGEDGKGYHEWSEECPDNNAPTLPGLEPWEYLTEVEYMGAYPYSKCHRVKIGTETLTIGGHAYDWKGEEEVAAKARLIAAAPELYEACKAVHQTFEGKSGHDYTMEQLDTLAAAWWAICKAEGRPEDAD